MQHDANLFPLGKYGRLRKGSSDFPSAQHNISLSQLGQAPTLQDRFIPDSRNRRARNHWHILCYFLHALLVALHLILLVVAVSHHAEHHIVVPSLTEAWMTGLSGGLQAFYTLYTAVLVFVTQRLMLSAVFSSRKKLTQIHDICGAWAGLGAALTALWQQTKVASSVLSIVLVTIYFTCISVLHMTSSTLMQFQMYNDTVIGVFSAQRTWPNASVDFGSLDWTAISPLLPFLQILDGSTTGLVNSTFYDIPIANGFLGATVSAMTLNANCGILTNLSINPLDDGTWNVNSSMSGLDPIGITVVYPPLLSEIWLPPSLQCLEPICSTFILFLVSAEMEVDDSIDGISHIYINGTYDSPSSMIQNISTPTYFVACSLNTTNHTIAFEFPALPLSSGKQPTNTTWSTFSPAGDLNLTSAISYAMKSANSLPQSSYCQPIMSYPALWANITAFNVYMISALGMGISPCYGTPLAQYASMPALLTRNQMESTISQIAAKFIWLAGQLGEAQGGFDQQILEYPMVMTAPLWCLNINLLPVIFALCASVILLLLMLCVLWWPCPVVVSGTGMLEIMWLGSQLQMLRDHLGTMKNPSLDILRTSAMFESIFWTHTPHGQAGNNDLCTVVPLCDTETCSGSFGSLGLSGSVTESNLSDLPSQSRPLRTSNSSHGTRHWCYTLHVVLVGLHATLLAFLVHHPEHSVVITSASDTIMIGLSAFLQAIYTIYTLVLIFLMRRLALLEIIGERRKLTVVHDVCGAWTGIGAAVYILWQQRKSFSMIRKLIPVVAYLTMVLVLHIASSSIMGWQQYLPSGVQMDVTMPDSTVDIRQLKWTEIFPVAQSVIQETGMFSAVGLQNSTLYDVSQYPDRIFPVGLINATTLSAQCGLVPNLTLSSENSEGEYEIKFLDGINNGSFLEPPIWKDVVYAIAPTAECMACPQTLFYLITTAIALDESIHDPVSVELNWTYAPSGGNPQTSTTLTYIAACSLSAQTILVSADSYPPDIQAPTSTSWSVWSPENATNLSLGIAIALSKDNAASFPMFIQGNSFANFTGMDSWIMSLLGLNLSYANTTSVSQSSANPSVTLSPWELESVIAQAAATLLWTAGQLGAGWGGFQRSAYQSQGINSASSPLWQLNVNTIPVLFASIASLISLILAVIIVGKGPSAKHPTSISGTSVLECLWLEAHSELLHSRLQTVEEPRLEALRAAGMFDICLSDIGRPSYPEAEQPILELADE